MNENKLKIGVFGSRTFEDRNLIKNFLFKLKDRKNEIVIVGLGDKDGADRHIKKYALEFGLSYKEANLPHTPQNLYSMLAESFYNKPYNPKNFFMRNKIYVSYVDKCVIFDDTDGVDKKFQYLVKELKAARKKAVILTS